MIKIKVNVNNIFFLLLLSFARNQSKTVAAKNLSGTTNGRTLCQQYNAMQCTLIELNLFVGKIKSVMNAPASWCTLHCTTQILFAASVPTRKLGQAAMKRVEAAKK